MQACKKQEEILTSLGSTDREVGIELDTQLIIQTVNNVLSSVNPLRPVSCSYDNKMAAIQNGSDFLDT